MSSPSVLIVGAGPTGLGLALWLKMLDPKLNFGIVSNAGGPGTKSRAIVVHARTLEFYRQLGIADRIIEGGEPVQTINVMKHGQRQGSLIFSEMGKGQSKFPLVLALPQDRHEKILLQRLEELKVAVEWNKTVQSVHQEDDHVMVKIDDELRRYQYVVGCDGGHSVVRSSSEIEMEGGTYPQRFYVADVVLGPSRPAYGLEITPGDGQVTIVLPLGEKDSKQIRLIGCYRPTKTVVEGSETFEDVRNLAFSATKLPVEHVNWFNTYAVHHRFASAFRKKRVFLAGDAAHLHSPVGGQGMNTGIGDAANLAWKLVAALAHEAKRTDGKIVGVSESNAMVDHLLQSYHTERVKFAKILVQTTDRIFQYVTQDSLAGTFFRDLFFPYILPLLWKIPSIPPLMYGRTSQIAIEYRESVLSAPSTAGGSVRSGDRVPFVYYDNGRDNHEPLDMPGWHIQIFDDDDAAHVAKGFKGIPVRHWRFNDVAQKRGLERDRIYLVRPDWHVGFIGNSLEDPKLDSYLVKWSIV